MHAFVICESLDSVVIPEGVTQIGDRAFQSCKALKSVALPQSLEKISLAHSAGANLLNQLLFQKP